MKTFYFNFIALIVIFAIVSFIFCCTFAAEWAMANLDVSVPMSLVFAVFASCIMTVVNEPKQEGKVILPSNI